MIDLNTITIEEFVKDIRKNNTYKKHSNSSNELDLNNKNIFPSKCKYFILAEIHKNSSQQSKIIKTSLKSCNQFRKYLISKDGELKKQ